MENSKKIQIGLLGALVLLLVANLFGGGIQNWFGKSEGDQIRESAANVTGKVNPAGTMNYDGGTGNIPGTNVNETPLPQGPTTMIRYEKDRYEFGVVNEGEIVTHIFKFTNVGQEDLLISNCKGSCGCTVPTWPKEPIPPGGQGEIKVEFNTKGKPGMQSKRVTVTANTSPTESFIEVKGEVRGKNQASAKGSK
jgi:hypothetical protein